MTSLRVHEWANHQSYRRDRNPPPWIKIHRNIMSNRKWARLSDAEKGQLVSIWVLAADKDGQVPNDAHLLRKLCMLDDLPNIDKFIDLGLLTPTGRQGDASAASDARQDDAPEADIEADIDKKRKPYGRTLRFDQWWDAYGKKVKRKNAEAIWRRKRLDDKADLLIEDAKQRRALDAQWKRGYQPDPTTYLNGERWNDEISRDDRRPSPIRETAAERRDREAREAIEAAGFGRG